MKRFLQISVFLLVVMSLTAVARDKKSEDGSKNSPTLQKKSTWTEAGGYCLPGGNPGPEDSGFPRPFSEFNQYKPGSVDKPAISTGYYFYDSDERALPKDKITDIWKPTIFVPDTNYQPNLWTRIVAGPRIVDSTWWNNPKNTKGKYYFRNPADILDNPSGIYNSNAKNLDTTDNAIAGPMPLGIKGGFFFNGIRYDSFYVSTNGVIALTNRRYVYGPDGDKAIPAGSDHCYDVNSMDWFVGGTYDQQTYPMGTRLRITPEGDRYGDADGDGIPDNNGLDDQVPDNFGYMSGVLGADPLRFYEDPIDHPMFTSDAGIRSNGLGTHLGNFTQAKYASQNCKPALISPFWGSLQISQYNPDISENDGFGKVYFKRTITNDSLIIGFYGMTFRGTVNDVAYGTMNYQKDARVDNTNGFVDWDAKVILDRKDSSITMVFERLSGRSSRAALCGDIIRANTTCGVLGWARHVNYDSKDPDAMVKEGEYSYPWADEYIQYTHYFSKYKFEAYRYPYSGTALKFKQWKNSLRVANINYLVRDTDPETLDDPSYEFTVEVPSEDYELLAGEPLIGAIQPRVLIQNLTNEIQGKNGVNFVEQDYQFWGRFKIRNLVTDSYIYNRAVPVSKYCMSLDGNWDSCYGGSPYVRVRLCNDVQPDSKLKYKVNSVYSGAEFEANGFNGVPPYRFVRLDFDPFVPNEFRDSHIGRMKAYVIAEPKDIKNRENMGDQWPFDDTTSTRFFVMKRLNSFQDDVTQYHIDVETQQKIPSVLKWVTLDGVVLGGKSISAHPLPPRGEFIRHMPGEITPDPQATSTPSPVINLNRLKALGTTEADAHTPVKNIMTEWGQTSALRGDEIRSYPIDIRGKYDAVFSISVHRDVRATTEYFQNYTRDWGEDNIKGPEGKTFVNGSPFVIPAPNGINSKMKLPGKGGYPDMLAVEFAKPSDDGVNRICNIEEEDWRHLPYRRGTKLEALDNMAALTIYGCGGYLRGFLETDPDSVLKWPDDTKQEYNAMRPDFYDTGHDWEFQKYSVGIPDTFIDWKAQGAKNFRFRVRVLADNHIVNPMIPTEADDADNFYLDNINILYPDEITDIEMSSVRIQWPYMVTPPSQATNVPIYVKLANGTSKPASRFNVKVKIYKAGEFDTLAMKPVELPGGDIAQPIFCRSETIANLRAGEEIEHKMPDWNVRKHLEAFEQKFHLVAMVNTPYDDMIPANDTTYFTVIFQTAPAFAYDPYWDNDDSGVPGGFGLSLPASNRATGITDEDRYGKGLTNDGYSGKIASKFELSSTDIFTGYQAYFGSHNSGGDYIEFMLYEGDPEQPLPSSKVVPDSRLIARRGEVDGNFYFNQYIPYYLDKPIELGAGTYWVSVSQLATEPLCLGGSPARTRMKIINYYQSPDGDTVGMKANHIFLDRNLRVKRNQHWVSDNYAAYINQIPPTTEEEKGNWVQFTPEEGNLGYPHTNHTGLSLGDNQMTPLYLNSSFFPMLRPIFNTAKSMQAGSARDSFEICPDDIPVQLAGFKGNSTSHGIELLWETASEENNDGFEVQRRIYGEEEWTQVAFIEGAGTSLNRNFYNFTDRDVMLGNTYQYQLRQLDKDGTVSCASSHVLTVKYDPKGELMLAQNTPNPVENITNIGYNIANDSDVKIEIVNMFGNRIKTLVDSYQSAGNYNVSWDSRSDDGSRVPAGTYIYRLTVGDDVIVKKMTVVR